jgi:hypothetical protein
MQAMIVDRIDGPSIKLLGEERPAVFNKISYIQNTQNEHQPKQHGVHHHFLLFHHGHHWHAHEHDG